MVELKGSLNGIGLPALVQLIGELRHTGSLELTNGALHGMLGFDDGRVVLATYGTDSGLRALTGCARGLREAQFLFVEGPLSGERTLDLDYADVQRQLRQFANGDMPRDLAPVSGPPTETPAVLGTCPLIGFADDRRRHYSRPTALHRCFASGAASLVTAQEQREFCLSDGYPACPRFRASAVASAAPATFEPSEVRTIPAGAAARLAAVGTTRVTASSGTSDDPLPQRTLLPQPEPATPSEPQQGPRPSRGLQLLVGGTMLGLIGLLAGVVLVVPSFNSGLIPRPGTPAPSLALQSLPTPTTRPLTTAAPTTPPAAAAVPTRPQASPTAAPRRVPNAQVRTLFDVRLVDGPGKGWRDNPPYVGWAGGAYRLQARQPARFVAVGVPIDEPLRDMTITATFRKTGGPPGGGYGLVIRDEGPEPRDGINQNMHAYVFEIGDRGEFGAWRRDGDHWFDLVPWTGSGAVHPGGSPNEVSVRATADQFVLSVNGVELATVQDNMLRAGGVGMFVGGDFNEVAVDRFALHVPN